MKKQFIPYLLFATCLFTACSTGYDEPDSVTPGEREMLSLSVSVSDIESSDGLSSRSSEVGKSTIFQKGDTVGLIVLDKDNNLLVDNVPYKLDDNWVFAGDSVKQPYYDAAMSTYIVYYPYKEEVNSCKTVDEIMSKDAFKPQENQNTEDNYRQADVLVWTSEGEALRHIEAKMKHVYDSFTFRINIKWELVPTGEELVYQPMQETLKNFTIEFTPDGGEKIILFDNDIEIDNDDETRNLIYHAEDGTYRYLLTSGQKGKITWQYTYRNITFRGERDINAGISGTRYVNHETADMGKLSGSFMEIGDFYCSVTGEVDGQEVVTGYVFPWDAADRINEKSVEKERCFAGRHCIGLVVGIGQHDNDLSDYKYNGIDIKSGIGLNSCHGYVMALTDAADQLEWAESSTSGAKNYVGTFYHFDQNDKKGLVDWNGFYNIQKIEKFISEATGTDATDWSKFPAANACKNYGTSCGLQSPANTSGWFLPSVGMLQYVWKTDDDIETASKKYQMTELLNERFATIKTYLEAGKDQVYNVYNDDQHTYKDDIKGFDPDKFYWSSNEVMGSYTKTKAISVGRTTNDITTKNQNLIELQIGGGSQKKTFKLTARAFLAF